MFLAVERQVLCHIFRDEGIRWGVVGRSRALVALQLVGGTAASVAYIKACWLAWGIYGNLNVWRQLQELSHRRSDPGLRSCTFPSLVPAV